MGLLKSIGKLFNDASGATSAAEQNYKYQKEFAQNAHQWEMADMKKAGLNPILSAGGAGASASGGGSGNMSNIGATDIANSAISAMQTISNLKLQKSQENLNDIKKLNEATAGNFIGRKARAEIKQMTTNSAVNEAKRNEIESQKALNTAKITSEKGNWRHGVGRGMEELGKLISVKY